MCYVAPEGVILGADSTASATTDAGHFHFFNHNQKLFEIGEGTSFGLLTWGLGGFPGLSIRTLVAQLGDELKAKEAASMKELAERWATLLWDSYSRELANEIATAKTLSAKKPHVPTAPPPAPGSRTQDEEDTLNFLIRNYYIGFCIGGYQGSGRKPQAYTIEAWPTGDSAPVPVEITTGMGFWGAPNFIFRSLVGFDTRLIEDVMQSGSWAGSDAELLKVLGRYNLNVPSNLPIRDAIDFVYSSIHQTIKALKFSQLNQICGGPIEIAVITTDRKFRWVRHKPWHAAIVEGEGDDSAYAKPIRH
jgi:hypothetical protein